MNRVSVSQAVYRLRRVPPRRLPIVVGRYAWRVARGRARRWQLEHNRGELSDHALQRALGQIPPEVAFDAFVKRFFTSPAQARDTARELARAFPQHANRTRDAAQRALDHVIDLLGSGPVHLGQQIDWHRDFKTGIGWPRDMLADDQDYLRLGEPCDVKVPWELSRCHHWVTLGRAYALDADARYAAEFVRQLEAWLDDNPWPYGVNWGRAMEVAVRAVNWLWAAALFAEAPELTPAHKRRFLKAMVQHGNHILGNLEYADNNGNHYLSNGVGLLFLGVLLPELAPAAAWRKKGLEIVWGEIDQQVHADGVDFEQGIGYQGLVSEFWYSCLLLCDRNGIEVPVSARQKLERMFDFVLATTRPDGTFPQIGDNDDGRLAGLDEEPVGSFRRHLAVGGVLFSRPDLLEAAGDAVENAAWLCGAEALHVLAEIDTKQPRAQADALCEPPTAQELRPRPDADAQRDDARMASEPNAPRLAIGSDAEAVVREPGAKLSNGGTTSRAFPEGGFYVMRSDDAHTVIDAGEVGMRGIGGHGHNDVLSFDLWAAGADVLVDSGTYTYTGDPAARQLLRSTAAHNALRVDGEETSRLGGDRWLWLIENDAHPFDVRWSSDEGRDVFEGSHDGYRRLPAPLTHTRKISFDKASRYWLIEDVVGGFGEHLVELFFHPGVPFEIDDNTVKLMAPHGDVWLFPPENTQSRQEQGWISRGYGLREPAPVLVYSLRASAPIRLLTHLVLVNTGTPRDAARSLAAKDS